MEDSQNTTKTEASEPDASGQSADEGGQESGFRERGRKERVLHTRISEQLAEDIRRVADDLRVPVSNLVRNVLEETFSVVESVTDNLGTWLEDVATEVGEARGARHPRHPRWARRRGHEREGEVAHSSAPERVWESPWDAPSSPVAGASGGGEASRPEPSVGEDAPLQKGSASPNTDGERRDFAHVLGWQLLVMNRPQSCADCGRLLVRGDRAYLGHTQAGVAGLVLCRACMDARE